MDKLFTPGSSVIVAQAEKPVSLCFSVPGLTTDGASSNCDVLASLIEKDMQRSVEWITLLFVECSYLIPLKN